jgi:hypothetical protein|tara:strand:+ start:2825 stop:3499 length:675 start_codon:yes stop_codon:yes gene_type:complete
MRKLIVITLLGLCVAATAQDEKAIKSEVSFEAGYTTLNQANGLGYLGNSAFYSASIAAKNKWVTPTVSATYLPQGSQSQANFTAGLSKSFLKEKAFSPSVTASYTRRELSLDSVFDTDEVNAGVSIDNKYLTPYVGYFNTMAFDNEGVKVGVSTVVSYKKLSLRPAAEYGLGERFWNASATLSYALTSNLTPYAKVVVSDNVLRNSFNTLDQEVATTVGIRFTF